MHWHIITGEYPPQIGGISDYTRQVALGLAAAGDRVEIWTTPLSPAEASSATVVDDAGITVHRLPDHFGPRSLRALDAALTAQAAVGAAGDADQPPRVLVQYEPWSFGWRGLNLPFCLWLYRRRKRFDLTTVFHEVCTDLGWHVNWKHNAHGLVTRVMAGLAVRASRRAFVTIPTWETLLRPLARKRKSIAWLPVPSNMPRRPDPARVRAARGQILAKAKGGESGANANGLLVGHFGTYRGEVARMLRALLPTVLRGKTPGPGQPASIAAVLVGRGSEDFAQSFMEEMRAAGEPELARRVIAAGALKPPDVAEHLAACDLLIQPYPDGISARRTSAASGLGLGQALVTNDGELCEPFWRESGAVRLVDSPSPPALAEAALALLEDADARARLRAAATVCYEERFDPAKVIAALRERTKAEGGKVNNDSGG